jgi:NADH-quinone oxidoreductase subunit N
VLLLVRRNDRPVETIYELDGLAATSPAAALALAVFAFGLTGLPPTGGFWGKFNLFLAAWSTGTPTMRWLAIALAINAAIAAWYYLALVRRAYLCTSTAAVAADLRRRPVPLLGVVGLCALGVVALFFFPDPLWRLLAHAGQG